jgi:SulP family sulfate permease
MLFRFFPFLIWLKKYQVSDIRSDLLAGVTVAVVLIPQAMAYAMLAGLPPVYGLYAAAVTPFIAALWGSLRQLATGPIAIMSLLVLTTLTPFAEPGSRQFIELSFLLAFMVGTLYLCIGLFRMGTVMVFISHSAVKGFTSAAALIIIATQLPHLLGISVAPYSDLPPGTPGIWDYLFLKKVPAEFSGGAYGTGCNNGFGSRISNAPKWHRRRGRESQRSAQSARANL